MEKVKIFDVNYNYLKDKSREVAHAEGLWHETFHCWLKDKDAIYIQKRSAQKKDFPSKFDITAAGHLEAHETVKDGIREIEEEIGLQIPFSKLTSLGMIRDVIELPNFYDYEFAHVYLYCSSFKREDFSLQKEEVESIHTIEKQDFIQLCLQKVKKVRCRNIIDETFTEIELTDFVPHQLAYFEAVAEKLKQI